MSSLDLSDDIFSSEDEDVIIANMETKSGLPEKGKTTNGNKQALTMIQTETSVATVKMSGMIRQGHNLYDSSESEGEEIMNSIDDSLIQTSLDRTGFVSSKLNKASDEAILTMKSSSEATFNGIVSVSTDRSEVNGTIGKRQGSVNSIPSSDCSDMAEMPSSYKESRFNPFDRDLHLDEDHFDVKQVNHLTRPQAGKLKSGKRHKRERLGCGQNSLLSKIMVPSV